jgi:transposase
VQIRFKAGFWRRSALEGEELRDDQWERIKRFVPGGRKGKRGPRSDGRRFFNALLWIARSGARWRDLPERFGPYQTAKRRYYRWIEMGVFEDGLYDSRYAARRYEARPGQCADGADQQNGAALLHRQCESRRELSCRKIRRGARHRPWRFSADGGKNWRAAQLGKDEGKYSFRQWQSEFTPAARGDATLMVRCTNTSGEAQPAEPNWNPAGFMRNVIESTAVSVT